ncbi:MAG: hypothetical protein R3189_03440 [Thiomicrorhabdus chilensis]|uniref:hypothetical protein n=1 Tax=Thiomicrorhabdus chilensis TaxID=63656 RepID=UPI00299F2373|nr:hypothetical protein [Thiomicrorhabdus chilensis]MDX1347286.1 hypothetical protein [Thiomicrorhabdus chilensis]
MNASTEEFALGAEEVQQTILILNLSVAQIDLSITEGDHSVNTLIDSFTYMSQHIEEIQASSQNILDLVSDNEAAQSYNALLASHTTELASKMQQAIIAFQFYDKLSQRLEHVSKGLSGLAEIVSHEMRVKNREEWDTFKQTVRKGTTMREEEELFELIFDQHIPTDEAIEIMRSRMLTRMKENKNEATEEEDEIELF